MIKTKPTGAEMAEMFSDFVNVMNDTPSKEFAEHVCYRTHRTLQQSIFEAFLLCVKNWADMYDKDLYDLRNEHTCKKAKEIVNLFDGDLIVPTI